MLSNQRSYTVAEFCSAERISRAYLYVLWQRGDGPDYYMVGNRRRITEQARLEWQRTHQAARADA